MPEQAFCSCGMRYAIVQLVCFKKSVVMKRVVLILVLMIFYGSAFAQSRSFAHLIGKWEAVDSENASGGLEVLDSSRLYLVYGTQKKPITGYRLDLSKSPGTFDFTVKDSMGNLSLKSLLQFINDDLIQWQVFDDAAMPAGFSPRPADVVYLRRKK